MTSDHEYDLIVAGGGPAGFAAAVSAGRLGLKTLLLEASTALGGMATMGLVNVYDPMADGERGIVGGIQREIMETLHERGQLPPWITPERWRQKYLCPSPIDPEAAKRFFDEMAAEAGVEARFLSRAVGVELGTDGRTVEAVRVSGIDGLHTVRAKAVIDATGDAALAVTAGVEYRQALRDTPSPMPASLCFVVANVDEKNKGNIRAYAEQALADGHFSQPEVRIIPTRIGPGVYAYNAGHIFHRNFADPRGYSESLVLGRKIAHEHVEYLRKYVPGYENCVLVSTATLLGVRETRRIVGEYELTWGDFADARHFPDQIGIYAKEVDIHAHSLDEADQARFHALRKEKIGWLPPGKSYGIPYGVIVPQGWNNLWVAGRAASFDEIIYGSIRTMPACSMMGEAAGAAAAQCLNTHQTASDLDTTALVEQLRRQGAYLPQPELSQTMTRGRGPLEPRDPVCKVKPRRVLLGLEEDEILGAESPPESIPQESRRPRSEPKPLPAGNGNGSRTPPNTNSPREFLRYCATRISCDCCRSTFLEADEFAAKLRELSENGDAQTNDPRPILEELKRRLNEECCQTGLPDADRLIEQATQWGRQW